MNRPGQVTEIVSECVPNIGARGRRSRRMFGVAWLVITSVVFVLLVNGHAPVPLFLVIAPLAGATALYFLQAREKT